MKVVYIGAMPETGEGEQAREIEQFGFVFKPNVPVEVDEKDPKNAFAVAKFKGNACFKVESVAPVAPKTDTKK